MILFEKDIEQYPTAIFDTQTTNTEWLRTASLFKSMGVKNYYFHLTLLQPELQGVDPFSPNLTLEQQIRIRYEVEYNPWYFFREIFRIPDGGEAIRFKSNRAVISFIWCFLCGIDYALIMPRQTGKSTGGDGLEVWLLLFYYRDTNLLIFTKDADLRKTTIERLKGYIRLLPNWLSPITKKDADNVEFLTCLSRGNTLTCRVGQQQVFLARKIGRGDYLPYVHSDEVPFIINVHLSHPALAPATSTARENNEAKGRLYGSPWTTTAGKLDSKEGKYAYNYINSGMPWNEKLYDCKDKQSAREMVIANSSKGRCLVHGTFSHRQIGKTDEWLRRVLLLADSTEDEIARDYFNKWTSGTESSAIHTRLLEIINASEVEPYYITVSKEQYMFRWYIEEADIARRLATGHYVLSLDSSNANGRDANGLVLTDVKDLSVIGTSVISEANLFKYAMWIARMLIAYPNITFIIENKSSGPSIIDIIIAILVKEGIDPFKRMYNRIVDNHKTMIEEYKEISVPLVLRPEKTHLKYAKYIGFNSTGDSRKFLYDTVLNDSINSTAHLIKDKTLANELKGLVIKNGRVDHIVGGHDDCVIAWLMSHWFIKHSKNLQHYGINPLLCLSMVSTDGATLTEEELLVRKQIAQLNEEVNVIKDRLVSSPGLIETLRDEKLLAHKVKMANDLGDNTLNLDTIMSSISESKVSKRNIRHALSASNNARLGLGAFNTRY